MDQLWSLSERVTLTRAGLNRISTAELILVDMASINNSTIAMALAGKSTSIDVPLPHRTGRVEKDTLTAKSAPAQHHPTMLPTPPNSISPSLPPKGFKRQLQTAKLAAPIEVDSDIDLMDVTDGPPSPGVSPQHGFVLANLDDAAGASDAAGAITPALLARHHLPEILLSHGPLAIRHVMGYLTTSVPGFSGIPPAKARRLVVGALEGRRNGVEGGGVNGDVEFEKVGWGRWDARLKGHPPRQQAALATGNVSPPNSMPSSYTNGALAIPNSEFLDRQAAGGRPGTSWAGDSAAFSHDDDADVPYHEREDVTMLEHEADKMSLDGSCSSSEAPSSPGPGDDVDDATDDEDWASMGAAALRQASYPASGSGRNYLATHVQKRVLSSSHLAKSMPRAQALARKAKQAKQQRLHTVPTVSKQLYTTDLDGVMEDSQEREAIEALVRLGQA
jgi:hypothetical protein